MTPDELTSETTKTSNVPVGSGVIVGEIVVTQPHLNLLSDPDSFSLTQRAGRMGPVTLSELIVGSDMSMDCGELCNTYRVIVLQSGRTECVHRGSSVSAGPWHRRRVRAGG